MINDIDANKHLKELHISNIIKKIYDCNIFFY